MKRRRGNRSPSVLPSQAAIAGLALACGMLLADSLFAGTANAAPAPAKRTQLKGPKTGEKDPIHIKSDRMEAYNKKNMIIFIGKVIAVQGAMRIQSDRLEVYVKKKEEQKAGAKKTAASTRKGQPKKGGNANAPGTSQGSFERLIAIGNVLVDQGEQKYASGKHLDYKAATGVAILTGNPRAWENKNKVVGTKIEMFLRDGRTVVHGSSRKRVSVTLFPEGEPEKPGKKPKRGSNEK